MSGYELVDVSTVRAGDTLNLPKLGPMVVAYVEVYDEPTDDGGTDRIYVVVYFAHDELTFENRARDRRGLHTKQRLVLKSLAQRRAGDMLEVERGNPAHAAAELARLERDQEERWHASAERQRFAAVRDVARRDFE